MAANTKSSVITILPGFDPNKYTWDRNDDWIDKGSFGDVYKARSLGKHRLSLQEKGLPIELAVKEITVKPNWPEAKYLNSEWGLHGKCKFEHKNLTHIYFLMKEEKPNMTKLSIFMELCHGSLKDYRNTDKSLPELKHILKGVLSGLSYLHSMKVLHRDLKDANILLKRVTPDNDKIEECVIKITDLNISKVWITKILKGHLPLKVIFHQRLSSIKGHLPSKVIFHQSLSSIKGRL